MVRFLIRSHTGETKIVSVNLPGLEGSVAKSEAQKKAEAAVKARGARKLPGRGRFSAVKAVKKETKKQQGKGT